MSGKPNRKAHLEALFKQYCDIPREAVIKEDLLNEGLAISPAPGEGTPGKDVAIDGGDYELRRTIVRVHPCLESPYQLRFEDGRWLVADSNDGSVLVYARSFPEDSAYATRTCAGGARCSDILGSDGELVVFPECQISSEDRCRFCGPDWSPESSGNGTTRGRLVPSPAQVAEAVGELFAGAEWDPLERPSSIRLTGGSIVRQKDGKFEEDFYLEYVAAIKSVVRNRYPVLLEMFPKPQDVEARLRQEGVNARLSNLAFWDRQLFGAICPGKERWVGWEEWVRRLLDQVDVYGQGHVLPGLILGPEMCEPWARYSLGEAVKTASKALNFLMRHGVTPRPIHAWMERSSGPQAEKAPVELFLETDRAWYETWQRYSMSEPDGYRMGPGRTRFAESAAFDVGRGTPLASRESEVV